MSVELKSYPHPVLGNGDDLGGFFKVPDFVYELRKDEIAINPTFTLKNKALEELISKGKASFVCRVESRSTFFRSSFSTRKNIDQFIFPAKFARDRVTAIFYICADENIEEYKPTDCNADYGKNPSFEVEKGDILAVGGYTNFLALKDFDPLRPPINSFFSIQPGSEMEGPMEVNYDAAKITVILSKEDWRRYAKVKNQTLIAGILHAAIVFPVLIDAVHKVQKHDSNYENYSWFERLDEVLDKKGLREKEPILVAQKILDNPGTRSFNSIAALLETDNQEEDI